MVSLPFHKARWMEDSDGVWLCLLTPSPQQAKNFCGNMGDRLYDADLKEHREKRSLDANAYCWVLIGKLNRALSLLAAFGVSAPQIPELGKLAYLAKGGILSSGSAIVGERGPELLSLVGGSAQVTPLTDSSRKSVEAGKAEYNQEINIYSHDVLTPAEIARENRLAMRKMVVGVRR